MQIYTICTYFVNILRIKYNRSNLQIYLIEYKCSIMLRKNLICIKHTKNFICDIIHNYHSILSSLEA